MQVPAQQENFYNFLTESVKSIL